MLESTSQASGRLLATRLTAQLLAGRAAGDLLAVVARLLAFQAQDQRGVRLAIRARSTGLTAADLDRALTRDRTLLITWLNRGTLHLVRSEDYPWLHALTTPPLLTGILRRLTGEGVTRDAAERGVHVIERSLAEDGPLTRLELRERIARAGIRTEGQALVHILALASLRGAAVRGPVIQGRHAYALVRDWLGPPARVDRDGALAELARRYLRGHGPADDRDLAKWAGLPLRDARRGLEAVARDLRREDGLLRLARGPSPAELPPPRLLGAFEPLLLGWRSRELVAGPHEPTLVRGGIFRPFALVRGRAAATWSCRAGELELQPFGGVADRDAAALRADAADVARFHASPRKPAVLEATSGPPGAGEGGR